MGKVRSLEIGETLTFGDRHAEPAKITKMEWSWELRRRDFSRGSERLRRSNRKRPKCII